LAYRQKVRSSQTIIAINHPSLCDEKRACCGNVAGFFVIGAARMLAFPLALKIIALHAGTFHFHSAQGAGTKITTALPKK